MSKKVVHYEGEPYQVGSMVYGIVPVDHYRPELNGEDIHTSRVISFDKATGEIETLNTIYRRVEAQAQQ